MNRRASGSLNPTESIEFSYAFSKCRPFLKWFIRHLLT